MFRKQNYTFLYSKRPKQWNKLISYVNLRFQAQTRHLENTILYICSLHVLHGLKKITKSNDEIAGNRHAKTSNKFLSVDDVMLHYFRLFPVKTRVILSP